MFYCVAVIAGFGSPLLLSFSSVDGYLQLWFKSPKNFFVALVASGIILAIIHYNTHNPFHLSLILISVEHPFLRADNRHFVFYIWRRTIRRHPLARYLAAPFYHASGWLVLHKISRSQSLLFLLGIVTCVGLTIIPSPLLEFRYFILPYLFWRLHLSPTSSENAKWRGIAEYLLFETINLATLWIFVSQPFTWDSEPDKLQRFIW
jgi:alpha-1,2-glucosyltransferase